MASDSRRRPDGLAANVLRPMVDALDSVVHEEVEREAFRRDPQFVECMLPLARVVNAYFGTEVRDFERLPATGPCLIVGNHSGGAETNDFAFLLERWVDERGAEAPLYALAYDLLFGYPVVGPALRRLGVVPANRRNAMRALRSGAAVLVFPGGDYEVFRPWSERNRIEFAGHTGFIEIALEAGVPVVPMTIHGAHQSTLVLTRGHRIARAMGMDRLHVNVFPLVWNIPLGVAPAFVPSMQLPSKVTVQIGHPLDWSAYGPAAARDPELVQRCHDEVTGVMQETLDALAAERPHPILSRLDDLRPSRVIGRWLWGDGKPLGRT